MNRYYNTDFDYSKAQPVESIGTSALRHSPLYLGKPWFAG